MSLLDKMLKAGSIKSTILSKSKLFQEKDMAETDVPIINVALSGNLDGGLSSGLTFLAGPSKHFKSLLGLLLVKAYMNKHPDAVCLFYDSEFGVTQNYVTSNGVDPERVIHIPLENLEQFRFDVAQRLEEVERGDKVIIFVDSVGNLASKKELDDALDGKAVADMTRARTMKSLWRVVTPYFTTRDIPCVAINHTYNTMEMFSKAVMSGGTGGMYSANQVFLIGKSQEKDGSELAGYKFTLNVEKSRFVKEKSKFPFIVKFDGGMNKWSGLLDLALESGHVIKPKNGWYQKVDMSSGEVIDGSYREKQTNDKDFWNTILSCPIFKEFVTNKYTLGTGSMLEEDEVEDIEKILDESDENPEEN